MTDRAVFGRRELLALAAIAAPFAIGWALVSPWQNVPVIDDWVYAWSVEHLLKTGRLRVADISAVYPVAQILWGSIFARALGFSFGALRLSTVILAIAGCWAVYLTLRELSIPRSASLLAAMTIALDPVYFAMAYTFMTDVPFVSVASIALYFYVSGFSRGEPGRFWSGAVFALVAFLIRPVAIVLPCAALAGAGWLGRMPRQSSPLPDRAGMTVRMSVWGVALPFATALLGMAAFWVFLPRLFGPLAGADLRLEGIRYWFLVTAREYASWNVSLVDVTPFPFAPLFLAALIDRRNAIRIAIVCASMVVALTLTMPALPRPLPDWQTWSLQDIAARAMIAGTVEPSPWSVRIAPVVNGFGIVIMSALLVGLAAAWRRGPKEGRVLLVLGALNFVLMNILWFYNDRYYLPFVPTLAFVAASVFPSTRAATRIAVAGLALWGFVSITGVRDMLRTNAACARLAAELEAQGIPPVEIDAGYALNGWRLYVHPENLPSGADRRYEVPFVNSDRNTLYSISSGPLAGYELVKEEKLPDALWQVTDRLYVLRRR